LPEGEDEVDFRGFVFEWPDEPGNDEQPTPHASPRGQGIRIEGGLLGPDTLEALLSAELPGQRPRDFGLDARRNLTDEIATAFADARALWGVFQHRLARLPDADPATSVTRDAWVVPFLGLLGYELRYNPRAYVVDGLTFAISHRAGEKDDAPPVHIVGARQELGRLPPSGRPRLSPHALLQEYLNRSEALWSLVTNGYTLRLLRDSSFVRRQAYVEFDLATLLEEQRFADFAVLYRLLHRSRLPQGAADAPRCLLEQYHEHAVMQGGRVREGLRHGVERCLVQLGNGFLQHADNAELRRRLQPSGGGNAPLTAPDLYRQLLRLVYRLLFLLVSEDRGLISDEPLYREHYGIARFRRLVDARAAYTDHDDLWQSLRVLWKVLTDEKLAPLLQVAPLNGELFAPLDLDACTIANRDLLEALWQLIYYEDERTRALRRVNYAALDVEELGSVYESLLEYHPALDGSGRVPRFDLVPGSERRATGSYYTPPEFVAELIRAAVDPVIAERLKNAGSLQEQEQAILSIRVCDPAAGSGHFLLAAARRLGKELARLRTGEDEPAPERLREAIRDVVAHCIYGVDKNPLAVELCRVALWLESHAEGKPLTFLDHRIRCGDSLVGVADLTVLEAGIPDEAFKPVSDDDRGLAREARRRNASERGASLFHGSFAEALRRFAEPLRALEELLEDTPEQVRRKVDACQRLEHSAEFARLWQASDTWTTAFFQPYIPRQADPVTTQVLHDALARGRIVDGRLGGLVWQASVEQRFFHWPLAFPEVFASGGFDVVVGNPPFMGGLRISGRFGEPYRKWLEVAFAPYGGTADLCAAFYRRAFSLLKPGGRIGMAATNTIGQGNTRESGLAVILKEGGVITFAKRFVKWPGAANVEVNLIAIHHAPQPPGDASETTLLDGQPVPFISSRLDADPEAEPRRLPQNEGKAFQGDIVRGIGFVLEPAEAESLLARDPRHADCLFPYLNGEDLNTHPEQRPSRWVICFHDWGLDRAQEYPDLLRIVEERVRPERERLRNRDDRRDRERWWLFARYRGDMRPAIAPLRRVIVISRVTEYHAICFASQKAIFSDRLVVFAFDNEYHFALLQSSIHEVWARRQGFTLESRYCYAPLDAFDTFPFPQAPSLETRQSAERVGAEYYEHRRQIMLARQLGLTKTYNLFHDPACTDADIVRLRELHAEMDQAVLSCYGWQEVELRHGFHQNDRGQTRFTVSPEARRELLQRLLALNQQLTA
jgi:hypothetical protein